MSEANTPVVAPVAAAATLYPADGGAAAAAAAATVPAGAGADTIVAAPAADTVVAGAGADTVVSGEGTDTVAAGTGADTTTAGTGADTLTTVYDFKLPENFQADDALTTEAKTVFAAAGVPADKAQGLVDLFGKAMTAQAAAQASAFTAQQQAWLQEINSMPEFTGTTKETSLASIGKLFDEFGTPEAKAALNAYGVGNNPALVKMMHKIATAINEGAPTGQGRPRGINQGAKPATVGSLYENDGRGPTK